MVAGRRWSRTGHKGRHGIAGPDVATNGPMSQSAPTPTLTRTPNPDRGAAADLLRIAEQARPQAR